MLQTAGRALTPTSSASRRYTPYGFTPPSPPPHRRELTTEFKLPSTHPRRMIATPTPAEAAASAERDNELVYPELKRREMDSFEEHYSPSQEPTLLPLFDSTYNPSRTPTDSPDSFGWADEVSSSNDSAAGEEIELLLKQDEGTHEPPSPGITLPTVVTPPNDRWEKTLDLLQTVVISLANLLRDLITHDNIVEGVGLVTQLTLLHQSITDPE